MKSKFERMGTNQKCRKIKQTHPDLSKFKRNFYVGDLVCRIGTSGIPKFGKVTQGLQNPSSGGMNNWRDREFMQVQWIKQSWSFLPDFEESPLEESYTEDTSCELHLVDRNILKFDYVWKDGFRGKVLQVEVATTLRDVESTKLVIYEVPAGLIIPTPVQCFKNKYNRILFLLSVFSFFSTVCLL